MTDPTMSGELYRITCHVPHGVTPIIRNVVAESTVTSAFFQTSRNVQIRERSIPFLSGGLPSLEETLGDTFFLYASPEVELQIMTEIILRGGLEMADRGSIYSRRVRMTAPSSGTPAMETPEDHPAPSATPKDPPRRLPIVNDIAAICCIVPRGQGSAVAQLCLEMGTSVPSVSLARGTGWRDRLGLLRITIPAEKELVTVVAPGADAPFLARRIVEAGRFERPGAGFLFIDHLERGLVNIRLWLGTRHHAASVNQLVAAVDSLWGDTGWRRRFRSEEESRQQGGDGYLHDMNEITLISREEETRPLLRKAMEVGAGGATTSRVVPIKTRMTDGPESRVGAMEYTTMIVPSRRAPGVIQSLQNTLPSDSAAPSHFIYSADVPWAYSYRRRTDS
jgi:hypothetical protein